jgi:hypothetical protein
MEIPLVGGAYIGPSTNINAQICQNLYPVFDNEGGKIAAMRNTPGLVEFSQPQEGVVRGMNVMDGYLYATIEDRVYRFSANGSYILISGVLLTHTGNVWMENNGTQIMIVDGQYGYIIAGTTLTRITDADFPTPSSLTYQDGYFIVSSANTGKFYLSGSYEGTTWDALDYATAEAYPDNLQAVISAHQELWLIGKESYEVWYNSGTADFPFSRISGAVNKVGTIAPHSVTQYQGTVFLLDNLRAVQMSVGYQTQKISTEQIDYQLQQYSTVEDAIGFCYQQEGHAFYELTFPTEGKTWVYDGVTKIWHTRASGTEDKRHRANCYDYFYGKHIVGDYENGKLYYYSLSTYDEDGTQVRRIRSAQAIHQERKNMFHHSLEIEFEAGVGLVSSQGVSPQAMLEWSDDGGHTFGNEHWATIGAMGKYKNRARWRRLGVSRDRIYRVMIADPVKTVIIGAYLEAELGNS